MPQTSSEMSSPLQPELKGKESEHEEFKEQDRNSLSTKKMINTSLLTEDLIGIKMSGFKQGNKGDMITIEGTQKKEQLKFDLKIIRSKIMKIDKAITTQKHEVEKLEDVKACEDWFLEEFLKSVEKKVVDAQTLLKNASKSKQEMNDKIEKLTDETGILKSEIAKIEKVLNKYKRYRRILFMLSPPEWQEAQQAETLRAKVLPKREEGLERDVESSPDRVLPPTNDSTLSSDHSDILVKNSKLDRDSTIYEDKLELYFSDPQQVIVLLSELTDQNLSLIHNITRVDKTMEHTIEVTMKKMKEDEEKLTMQVKDMEDRADSEKKRVAMLKKNVQLHESLKTEDQDIMLDALAVKVTEVYSSCIDKRLTRLSTLEKLSGFENHMSLLFQQSENIPEEMLNTLRRIKDSERRSRQREEKLKLEMEKHRERMKKCIQRSLGEAKKIYGRKLMPRCFPVKQKIEVVDEVTSLIEDNFHAHLFTEDSD